MKPDLPPTIDSRAAQRWADIMPARSPWLHEEVARRMEDRLQWIVNKPKSWLHWAPLSGGTSAHMLIAQRYPKAECFIFEQGTQRQLAAKTQLQPEWWKPSRWTGTPVRIDLPETPVEMIWANMSLHTSADPLALIGRWQKMLSVNGFVMFSCFGPDTLREIRDIYREQRWPDPHHAFTDMHDLGDMLVHAGFAEPVMDMERITLSYSTPEKMLAELRELGRNLHIQRHRSLRGRGWLEKLHGQMVESLQRPESTGRLSLTFEIIYGHAFKPLPRIPVKGDSQITLEEMRQTLGLGKTLPKRS